MFWIQGDVISMNLFFNFSVIDTKRSMFIKNNKWKQTLNACAKDTFQSPTA